MKDLYTFMLASAAYKHQPIIPHTKKIKLMIMVFLIAWMWCCFTVWLWSLPLPVITYFIKFSLYFSDNATVKHD